MLQADMKKTPPFTAAGFRALAADQTIERRRLAYFASREAHQKLAVVAWRRQYARVMHGIIEISQRITWAIAPPRPPGAGEWAEELIASSSAKAHEELVQQTDSGHAPR